MASNIKQGLNDVYILRPIAIFFIIVYHAFIIYRGGWEKPSDYQDVTAYYTIATISYAFWLELFVFISGYLFALSLKRKQSKFKDMFISKFKRLILPSILFSTIYYFMFYYPVDFSALHCIMKILSGAGHLWFLPMLFWTMLICYVIDKSNKSAKLKVVGVLLLPVLSLVPFPFQLNHACYYTMYFYIGMLVFRNRDSIIEFFAKRKWVLLGTVIFIVLFALGYYLRELLLPIIKNDVNIAIKAVLHIVGKYAKIAYCLVGIFWIYLLVNYLLNKEYIKVTPWIINLSALCFGIYLFQQFILQWLYYKTSIPSIVGPYYLPWMGLIITVIGSCLLTKLCRMTRIGRRLM